MITINGLLLLLSACHVIASTDHGTYSTETPLSKSPLVFSRAHDHHVNDTSSSSAQHRNEGTRKRVVPSPLSYFNHQPSNVTRAENKAIQALIKPGLLYGTRFSLVALDGLSPTADERTLFRVTAQMLIRDPQLIAHNSSLSPSASASDIKRVDQSNLVSGRAIGSSESHPKLNLNFDPRRSLANSVAEVANELHDKIGIVPNISSLAMHYLYKAVFISDTQGAIWRIPFTSSSNSADKLGGGESNKAKIEIQSNIHERSNQSIGSNSIETTAVSLVYATRAAPTSASGCAIALDWNSNFLYAVDSDSLIRFPIDQSVAKFKSQYYKFTYIRSMPVNTTAELERVRTALSRPMYAPHDPDVQVLVTGFPQTPTQLAVDPMTEHFYFVLLGEAAGGLYRVPLGLFGSHKSGSKSGAKGLLPAPLAFPAIASRHIVHHPHLLAYTIDLISYRLMIVFNDTYTSPKNAGKHDGGTIHSMALDGEPRHDIRSRNTTRQSHLLRDMTALVYFRESFYYTTRLGIVAFEEFNPKEGMSGYNHNQLDTEEECIGLAVLHGDTQPYKLRSQWDNNHPDESESNDTVIKPTNYDSTFLNLWIVLGIASPIVFLFLIIFGGLPLIKRYIRQKTAHLDEAINGGSSSKGATLELAFLREHPNLIGNLHENELYVPTDLEIDLAQPDSDLSRIPRVSPDAITKGKELGKGAFGEVFEGSILLAPDKLVKVAMKTLRQGATPEQRREFIAEARYMAHFDHPNVLRLIAISITPQLSLCMELMSGGDLRKYVYLARFRTGAENGASPFTAADLIEISHHVALGCAYLESHHFVHRDLAARNCLVSESVDCNTGQVVRTVKIGDFGLARDVYKQDYYRKGSEGLLPVRWMPPEAIVDGLFTTASDVWAFGVLMWEVTSLGQQPYYCHSNVDVIDYVKNGGILDRPENCPMEMYELMRQCWSFDAESRPTFAACVNQLAEISAALPHDPPPIFAIFNPNYAHNRVTQSNTNNESTAYSVGASTVFTSATGNHNQLDGSEAELRTLPDIGRSTRSSMTSAATAETRLTFGLRGPSRSDVISAQDLEGYEIPISGAFATIRRSGHVPRSNRNSAAVSAEVKNHEPPIASVRRKLKSRASKFILSNFADRKSSREGSSKCEPVTPTSPASSGWFVSTDETSTLIGSRRPIVANSSCGRGPIHSTSTMSTLVSPLPISPGHVEYVNQFGTLPADPMLNYDRPKSSAPLCLSGGSNCCPRPATEMGNMPAFGSDSDSGTSSQRTSSHVGAHTNYNYMLTAADSTSAMTNHLSWHNLPHLTSSPVPIRGRRCSAVVATNHVTGIDFDRVSDEMTQEETPPPTGSADSGTLSLSLSQTLQNVIESAFH